MQNEEPTGFEPSAGLSGQSIMEGMEEALEEVNKRHSLWVWAVFLLVSSTGIFNAHHIIVSEFYASWPRYECQVRELEEANWTKMQIKSVTKPSSENCAIVGWNYRELAKMNYNNATKYLASKQQPKNIACTEFHFYENTTSVVSEWSLVCGRTFLKTSVQGSIALGKLIGGYLFGFLADKFGRKFGFNVASVTYMISGPLAAFSPNYWFFVTVRFFIGVAGAGVYETGFTLMAEVISKKRRSSLGCLYSLSYPVGYMTMPLISLAFSHWRHIQLAISLPMLVLIFHCWFLPESPRWLLTQGKFDQAWSVIKKVDHSLVPEILNESLENENQNGGGNLSLFNRTLGGGAQKVFLLFSEKETCKRFIITAFANFVAALIYYILAFNSSTFGFDQRLYTFLSGLVEVPGYISPLIILMFIGRKTASFTLYALSGLALLTIIAVPKSEQVVIFVLAMLGRYADVAVFALIILYTSELFPTTVRNAGVGSSLATSQFGSIFAPYVVEYLRNVAWYFPSSLCGVAAISAALVVLLLPETRGRRLLDTIDEMKQDPDRVSMRNCLKCS